ncbi:32202_t:CDS:2, partial [Racocetra persica]
LSKHKKLIQDANTIRPTIYELPERAIEEIRKTLVYHIKERLKQHSKHAGNAHVIVNCTESQFFSVFKGYIHNYYPKMGNYKCIFKGADSYSTLSYIFRDDNWGVKYFLQYQKTFILSYQLPSNPSNFDSFQELYVHLLQEPDPLQEPDLLQEPDPLRELNPLRESDPFQKLNQIKKFR